MRELVVSPVAPIAAWPGASASASAVPGQPDDDPSRFGNGCLQVQLNANCRQNDVFIVQTLAPPAHEHLMELLLMLDAARGASAARVTAVIPYYSYARSDKKDAPRISIGGRLVADLLVTSGANRVLTMALHAARCTASSACPSIISTPWGPSPSTSLTGT